MATANPHTKPSSEVDNLKAIAYEDTKAANAPIQITTPQLPRHSPNKETFTLRKATPTSSQQLSATKARTSPSNGSYRDSGLAPSSSTTPGSNTTLENEGESRSSTRNSPALPLRMSVARSHPQRRGVGDVRMDTTEKKNLNCHPSLSYRS